MVSRGAFVMATAAGEASAAGTMPPVQGNWSEIVSQKEVELNALRERHVAELEERLKSKEAAMASIEEAHDRLREDFKYNLEVLEERDRDLKEYDEVLAREVRKGQDRSKMIDETRAVIDRLQRELQSERQARSEEQGLHKQRLFELKEDAENAKFGGEEALLRQREAFERRRRELERECEELRGEAEARDRALRGDRDAAVQRLESELRLQRQEAAHESSKLRERSEALEAEVSRRKAEEEEREKALAEATERAAEAERVARSVTIEFEEWKLDRETCSADLQRRLDVALRNHQAEANAHKAAQTAISSELRDLQAAGERLEAAYARRVDQEHSGLIAERDSYKVRAEAAEDRCASLEGELEEERRGGEAEREMVGERVGRLERERNEAVRNLTGTRSEITAKYQAEIRVLREELWSKNEEVSALRAKETIARGALDDRRGDINSYKEQLASSLERERELKRSLRAMELKAELDLEKTEASVSATNENVVRQLTQDKDTSSERIRQFEERVRGLEAELEKERSRAEEAAAAAAAGAAMAASKEEPAGVAQRASGQGADAVWSPDSSLLGGLIPNIGEISPAVSLERTPGRADPLSQAKIKELDLENNRLRDVISALRQEMESVEGQADAASGPQRVAALEAELAASDADYQRSRDHVRILQERGAGEAGVAVGAELEFLRAQQARILEENRSMRRLRILPGAEAAEVAAAPPPPVDPNAESYGQERLLVYSKLCDMRAELGAAGPGGAETSAAEGMVAALAQEVGDLVKKVRRRLEARTSKLRRTEEERDRILDLNNALRSSMAKAEAASAPAAAAIPSLPDRGTDERLQETNEKLSYVQSSLVDLTRQSEELVRYQREAQAQAALERPAGARSQGAPPAKSRQRQQRPRSAAGTSAEVAAPSKAPGGLQLRGNRAPSSTASRGAAANQGTASQRAKLQAIALKRQRREAREREEQQRPQIRNYNIRDDRRAAEESAAAAAAAKKPEEERVRG